MSDPHGYQPPTSGPAYGGQPTSHAGYPGQPAAGWPAQPAGQVVPYSGYPTPAPSPYWQPQVDQFGRPLSDKSKVVAGLLGILLGGFGAGRFYTGHTGLAVGQLLVTLFTCGLGHFWGLIDGIILLVNGGTDAQGRVLRNN